jgi:hypothetical protein
MTEYTSSPEAVREYMNSRERTAYWVRNHSPTREDFYSPSALPAELPPTPTSPPSEVESTHSIPPKMVLKYKDGRPDIPISHGYYEGSNSTRSSSKRHGPQHQHQHQQNPSNGHIRSRSHSAGHGLSEDRDRLGRSSSRRTAHTHRPLTPLTPEEIRVWPSETVQPPRSKSLPRDQYFHNDEPPPPLPSSNGHAVPLQTMFPPPPPPQSTPSRHASPTSPHHSHHHHNHNVNHNHGPVPRIAHPQPRPLAWHSIPNIPPKASSRAPPAIVYAPSHHSKTNFSPPPIVPAYPHQNVGGMKFSHSAPVRYPDYGEPPFPLVHGTATTLSSFNDNRSNRRGSPRDDDRDSDDSGSTYYVLPSAGQRVHIIVSCLLFCSESISY